MSTKAGCRSEQLCNKEIDQLDMREFVHNRIEQADNGTQYQVADFSVPFLLWVRVRAWLGVCVMNSFGLCIPNFNLLLSIECFLVSLHHCPLETCTGSVRRFFPALVPC